MSEQSTITTARVLRGVPRVQFYEGGVRCPEDIIFPSVLRAWLEYANDQDFGCKHCLARAPNCKVNCTYSFLMGVSGTASFLSWAPGWQRDNVALHYMSDDADAPYRRAFKSVGYGVEWIVKEPDRDNESLFRQRIRQSIDQGRPVIAFGVIGPPEPTLINGYEAGGEALLGWSFFQSFPDCNAGVIFDPSGYFCKRDWFKHTDSLAIVSEKKEKPDLGKVYRDGLEWMVQVAGTPVTHGNRHTGLAAYQAWADDVTRDDQFPADREDLLRQRFSVHNDAVSMVAEARWYGSIFLQQAVEFQHYKMAEDLLHAAALYTGEHDLMWKVWDLAGGNGNPDGWKFMLNPQVRRQIVQVILQARDKDAAAIEHIQHALAL